MLHTLMLRFLLQNNILEDIRQLFALSGFRVFMFHHLWQKDQAATENASNSEKHTIHMREDIDFYLFHNPLIINSNQPKTV